MPRFGLVQCEDRPQWAGSEQLFISRLQQPGDVWDVFHVSRQPDSLPTTNISEYDGFVLTGSHHTVYDTTQDWIAPLLAWTRFVLSRTEQPIRMYASCFGHQAIALALGGRVMRNPSGVKVIGIEEILPEPQFWELSYVQSSRHHSSLNLIESHSDCVSVLPPGAVLLARSKSAEIEIFSIGDRVLSIQAHPEFTLDVVQDKILSSMVARQIISEESAKLKIQEMKQQRLDSELVLELINNFLRSGISHTL